LSGREETIALAQAQARKRSGSLLAALPSSSPDLDRLFSKTRAVVEKEELLVGAGGRGRSQTSLFFSSRSPKIDEDDDEDEGADATSKLRQASPTLSAASDAKDALIARGVKLKRLDQQSDALRNGAADYASTVAEHRKKLSERAARWGLF